MVVARTLMSTSSGPICGIGASISSAPDSGLVLHMARMVSDISFFSSVSLAHTVVGLYRSQLDAVYEQCSISFDIVYCNEYEQRGSAPAPPDLSLIHISEPTRLGMISYAVFCLKKKK